MEIKIFCNNCKVEILRADTDTLKSPLVGEMFRVKKDMEWALFSDHDTANDLICPMCDWVFHENGKVKVVVGNEFIIGIPELIIPGILAGFDRVSATVTPKETVFIEESGGVSDEALNSLSRGPAVVKVTPDLAMEAIQKQVEGEKTAESTEVDPKLTNIQSIVEGKPEKESDVAEKPDINQGAWTESQDADENSEINGDPPPGTAVAESGVTKPKQSRKIKKRGSKKKIK